MDKPSKETKRDPWKEKARQEILTHLQDRAWVKHFLEKHVWLTHRAAYPSVAGSAFSDISDKIKERQFDSGVKYVFVDERHLTKEFMERVGRINSHISSENHSKTLEVLLALALIIIQKEMESFEEFDIYMQKQVDGGKPDFIIDMPCKVKIFIDAKNRLSNFSDSNVEEMRKYSGANTALMVVHPFFSRSAQSKLQQKGDFYCNVGRIYTGHYGGIEDDFSKEGLENGTVVIKWDTIRLYQKLRENIRSKRSKLYDLAEKVFKEEALNYFLKKIRGIVRFAILKHHFKFHERLLAEQMELGMKCAPNKQDVELLRMIPLVYFEFLFRPKQEMTISSIAQKLTKYEELKYYNKLDSERRKEMVRKALRFLQGRSFLKLRSKDKWYADDIESPYPTERDILDGIKVIDLHSLEFQ